MTIVSPDRLHAMREAVIAGNVSKVRLLLKSGVPATAKPQHLTLLQLAARFGHYEVFRALVAAGACDTDPELLEHAVDGKAPTLDVVRHIIGTAKPGQSTLDASLRYACVQGNAEIVQALIDAGADVNAVDGYRGSLALLNAILAGHESIVELLLAEGAAVDVRVFDDPDETAADNPHKGKTAIELAASLGHTTIAGMLRARSS